MTKKDFVILFKEKADLKNIEQTDKVLNAFLESLEEVLVNRDEIAFLGFGKFEVIEKAAREGRNPRTGEAMNIPAKKSVKFKTGKSLAEKINR